jgi:hypothetical protein
MKAPTKKILGIGLAALLIIAIAAYFITVPAWEKEQEDRARTLLAAIGLKADTVKADFFGQSLLQTGVSGDLPVESLDMTYAVDFETISASGINLFADQQKGVTTLADSLVVTNASFSSSFQGMDMNGAIKEGSLKGLRLDLGSILEVLRTGESWTDVLFKVLPLLESFHVDHAVYKDYTVTMEHPFLGSFVAHIDSAEARDMGLLKTGPASMDNWTLKVLDREVFSMRRLSLDQLRFPNIFSLFDREPEDIPSPEEVLDLLAKSPFIMKGLSFQDIKVRPPLEEVISLGGLNLDFAFLPTEISLALSLDSFSCPARLPYEAAGLWRLVPADLLEGALVFSGKLGGALKLEGEQMNLTFSNAAEIKDLGSVSASADLALGKAASFLEFLNPLQRADLDVQARSLTFSLRDSGFLKTYAKHQFLLSQSEGATGEHAGEFAEPGDVLRQMARDLSQELEENPVSSAFPTWVPSMAAFLEQSGSLTFTLRADPPLPLGDDFPSDPHDLPAGVTLTLEHKP